MAFRKREKEEKGITVKNEQLPAENGHKVPPRPGREKKGETLPPDPYFEKLYKHTRRWRYAVTIVLLLFTVGMAFFYSEEITAENLKLLLRNASFSLPGEDVRYTEVRYAAAPSMDFISYREYLAVATAGEMRLYDQRGNVALEKAVKMEKPTFDAGQDYILLYDREGKTYLLCNSVAALYEGSEEYPIYGADVSDNGSYLILTGTPEYSSVLKVYNRSFRLAREVKTDRYPLAAKLSGDGTRMALACYTCADSGEAEGHILVYELGEKTELLRDISLKDLPLMISFDQKNRLAVLTEKGLYLCDAQGQERAFRSFEGRIPVLCATEGEKIVVSFEDSRMLFENTVWCYDTEKDSVWESPAKGHIRTLFLAQGFLFAGEKERLTVWDTETGATQTLSKDLPEKVFGGTGNTIFVCYRNKAEDIYDSLNIGKEETGVSPEEPTGKD